MILNLELSKEEVIKFIFSIKQYIEINNYLFNNEKFILISPKIQTYELFSEKVKKLINIVEDDESLIFIAKYIEIHKNRITFIVNGPNLVEYQFKCDIDSDDFEKLLLGLNF